MQISAQEEIVIHSEKNKSFVKNGHNFVFILFT